MIRLISGLFALLSVLVPLLIFLTPVILYVHEEQEDRCVYPIELWDAALRHCTRKIERDAVPQAERAEAFLVRGILYAESDRYEAALADIDQAMRIVSGNERLFAYRAWILAELGRSEEAWADIAALERLAPQDPLRFFVRAAVHRALGDLEAAREAYVQAVAALTARILERPRFAFLYTDRARALIALDRYDDALADLERAVELDPTDVEALRLKVRLLKRMGRREEATLARDKLHEALDYPLSMRLLERFLD